MKLFRSQPVTLLFLCFFTATCLFGYGSFPVRMGAATGAVFCLTLLFCGLFDRVRPFGDPELRRAAAMALVGIAAAGTLSSFAWDFAVPWYEAKAGTADRGVWRITDCEFSAVYASRYRAEVMESEVLPKGTRIVLSTTVSGLENGALVGGETVYGPLSDLGSGTWDARRSYLADGVVLAAEGDFEVLGSKPSYKPSALFARLRARLTSVFLAGAGRDAGGFASAILFGNRDHLPDALTRDFRRLGLSHLLVVSGTHFTVLISFLTQFFRRMKIRRRPRAVLSMAVIVLFMLLTGGSPSVLRAGLMHLLVQLSILVRRRPDTIHSFALSGAAMVLFRPLSAVNCGLQLSFMATWACIVWLVFRPALYRKRKKGAKKPGPVTRFLRSALETVLMTGVVTLATMPLIWSYFGELPLLSLPANVLFLPVVTLTLGYSWICLLVSPVKALSVPLFGLLGPIYRGIAFLAEQMARIPGTVLSVRYGFAPFLLIPAAVCLAAVPLFDKRGRRRAVTGVLALTAAFFALTGVNRAMTANDVVLIRAGVKKNEGFLLQVENRILVCDMSDGSASAMGRLTAKMDDCHACEIDAVALTHYHRKHAQMLGRLFSRQIVRALWLPEPMNEEEEAVCRSLADLCAENGVELRLLPVGEGTDFHGVSLAVEERTWLARSTHPLSGASVEMPGGRVFFGSSSFNESEALTREAERADVLILGGHSPVYKKTFALPSGMEPKVIAWCEDAADHADPDWFAGLSPACRIVPLEEGTVFEVRGRRGK